MILILRKDAYCVYGKTTLRKLRAANAEGVSNVIEATLSFLIILFLVAFILGLVLGVSLTRPPIR